MNIQKKISTIFRKKVSGLSLLEVLTVLIIIGLTSLVVVRNLSPTVNNVRKKEAQFQLKLIHTFQQTYFMEFTKYSGDLEEIGYAQRLLSTEGGDANYKIELVDASINGFKARATAVVDFNQNGVMDVWEIDQSGKVVNTVKD
ncbi:MAG: type II secretion system GspH family protein [Flavobacteriales bacterium]|jgi:type IV pilus assembly protein PilE|nr:type II secretion system GspH family protein [Flavobacteriales bacterium]